MYEIAARQTPFAHRMDEIKASGGNNWKVKMFRDIGAGTLRLDLDILACNRFGVGLGFRQLFSKCTAFDASERPKIEDLVQQLDQLCTEEERVQWVLRAGECEREGRARDGEIER